MSPFDQYPYQGRRLLGAIRGDNARRGYGLKLHRLTGATSCAYCGLSFVDDYYHWLLLSVDHVVPASVARLLGVPIEYYEDAMNKVLSCNGCNGFDNRYTNAALQTLDSGWTLDGFVALRDDVFAEPSARIAQRRSVEEIFFVTY